MVSTFTGNKRIEQPAHNDYVDSWDVPVNANWELIDKALGDSVSVNLTGLSGTLTLSAVQYLPLKIIATGTPTGNINMSVPSGVGGLWVVRNNTAGGFNVGIISAAGGTAVIIPATRHNLVTCDGTSTGMVPASTTEGVGGANTQVQFNDNGLFGGSTNLTWDKTANLLTASSLIVTGSTTVGNAIGDVFTINTGTVTTVNGLNFNSNQLVLGDDLTGTAGVVSIGTAPVATNKLTVAGRIASTASGYSFPDNTVQTTAYQVQTKAVSNVAFVDFTGIPSTINNIEFAFALRATATRGGWYLQFYRSGVLVTAAQYFSLLTISDNASLTGRIEGYGNNWASVYLGSFGTLSPTTGRFWLQNIQDTDDTIGQGVYSGIANNNSNYFGILCSFGFISGVGGPITGVRFGIAPEIVGGSNSFSGRVTMTSTI